MKSPLISDHLWDNDIILVITDRVACAHIYMKHASHTGI